MPRPERPAPGGASLPPEEPSDADARAAARLLASLAEDAPAPPGDLVRRVARRVRNRITLRDLIELATRAPLRALLPLVERLVAPLVRASRVERRPAKSDGERLDVE